MGEHKGNVMALYQASLPKIAPVGSQVAVQVLMRVAPAAHIVLVQPDEVRTTEAGATEVLTKDGSWKAIEAGQRVHELGKPLEAKDCVVICDLVSFVSSPASLITPDRKTVTSGQALTCLWQGPLAEWQASHRLGPEHAGSV